MSEHPRLMPWMKIYHGKYGILIAICYGKLNARNYGKVLAVYISSIIEEVNKTSSFSSILPLLISGISSTGTFFTNSWAVL